MEEKEKYCEYERTFRSPFYVRIVRFLSFFPPPPDMSPILDETWDMEQWRNYLQKGI